MFKPKSSILFLSLIVLLTLGLIFVGCDEVEEEIEEDLNGEAKDEDVIDEDAIDEDAQYLLDMGSSPVGTPWYLAMSESANVINRNVDNVSIAVQEAGGTHSNAIELVEGNIDIAYTEAFIAHEAFRGEGRFEEEDLHNPDFRLFNWLAVSSMHWAVAEGTGITSFEELEGEDFNPSTVGGGGEYITEHVFDLLGFETNFHRAHISDAIDMVRDGQIVGLSYNGTVPIPAFQELHAQQPLHLLSLDEEQQQKVVDEYEFLLPRTLPAGAYEGTEEANTIGIHMGIAMNKDLDADLVYEMAKAYYENIEEVQEMFPPADEFDKMDTIEYSTVPLHAGVVKYFEEDAGIEVPEDLIPEEYDEVF